MHQTTLNIKDINQHKGFLLEYDRSTYQAVKNLHAKQLDVRVVDPRNLNREQQKKIYAIIGDIADWTGDDVDYLKERMKQIFMFEYDCDYFSLSNVDRTTARLFIEFLIRQLVKYHVPLERPITDYVDDVYSYVYASAEHRTCAVCGLPADIHHLEGSRVGSGRDRNSINHVGLEVLPLCRKHHNEVHSTSEKDVLNKYHLQGIKLDEYLCEVLGM